MLNRKIVQIDEEKCNGCGLCVPSCAEGAIQIIDGKAKLVKDQYCDGLGACLGECPQDAISIIEREAEEFNEHAAMEHVKSIKTEGDILTHEKSKKPNDHHSHGHSGCPGSNVRILKDENPTPEEFSESDIAFSLKSQLRQWPVQISLVPVNAQYFKGASLLVTADCVPFAYADYHPALLKGKVVLIGCPKLDDIDFYIGKLTAIVKSNDLKDITVAFMEVPCCSGIVYAVEQAVKASGKNINIRRVRITIDGKKIEVKG